MKPKQTNTYETTSIENNKSYNNILAYTGLHTFRVRTRITDSDCTGLRSFSRLSLGNERPNDTEQMHSNCPNIVVGELMVPALPSSDNAEYINPNIEVTQWVLKWSRYESAIFVTNIVTNIT